MGVDCGGAGEIAPLRGADTVSPLLPFPKIKRIDNNFLFKRKILMLSIDQGIMYLDMNKNRL